MTLTAVRPRMALIGTAAGFGIAFVVLTVLVANRWTALERIDNQIVTRLHGAAVDHPTFGDAMRLVSNVFDTVGWWIILGTLCAWLLLRRQPRTVALVAITAITSSLANYLVKDLVARHRPEFTTVLATAHGSSFPSGHAQAALVGFGLVVVVLAPLLGAVARGLLGTVAVLGVATVGLSRIALGVHNPSDVLGGYLLGATLLCAGIAVAGPVVVSGGRRIVDAPT